MSLFVDTSVWSLALRRDVAAAQPEVKALIQPDRDDHIHAVELRNKCRRSGVQIGTVDAVIAQLCIRHGLTLLTTDLDYTHAAKHCELVVWPDTFGKRRAGAEAG